jgi:membrane protease subunit (stomatin/prohibitin family)
VSDYDLLIEKVAGVKQQYKVDDIKLRITTILDQLLMKWISKEGKDMFNLQANAFDISKGIKEDLDMEISKDGITITGFSVNSFNYPQEVQDMITKNAAQSMVGDVGRYQQISMTDAMADGKVGNNSTMGQMTEMMMGMTMANNMMNQMGMNNMMGGAQQQAPQQQAPAGGAAPKFCPNCGQPTNGAKFCGNCGQQLA